MTATPAPRPLLITDDPDLLDDLLRLAAASGVEVEVAADPVGAQRSWASASLVVIGAALASACVRARLPRREGIVLVGRDGDVGAAIAGATGIYDDDPSAATVVARRDDSARAGSGVPPLPGASAPLAEPPPGGDGLWRLAADLGADHVILLPTAEPWLIDRFTDAAAGRTPAGRVIGVIGGRGGAGASVLAAALAVTASRLGLRPLLLDCDPLGGGLDLVFGGERMPGLRWPDLAATAGRVSAPVLFDALPRVGELCVLSWDRGDMLAVPPDAVDAAIGAGRRGSDLVVVDLPRRPDEAAVHALQAADSVLLVVPAEVRACAAAVRVTTMVRPHCRQLRCVVRGPAPAGLRSRDLAAALAVPLAGVLRPEPGLAARLDRGEPPASSGRGPLAELCRRLLADLDNLTSAA